jgi:transmembrane sensor
MCTSRRRVQFCPLPRVYIHKMSRFSLPSSSRAPFDEVEEARALAEFFGQQDPVDVAAADWHTRAEQGLSAQEKNALAQWLAADPAHAAAWRGLDQDLAALRALPAERVARMRAAATAAAATAAAAPAAPAKAATLRAPAVAAPRAKGRAARPWPAWRLTLPRPGLLAASCAALLALAVLGAGWHQWQQPTFAGQYAAERAQRKTITLPDGTQLALDADTQAQVTLYRDRREVRLVEGQILFAVAADSSKPFHVLAGPARVSVVGTRFSVRYRSEGMDAGRVKIAVEEGHVRVSGLPGAASESAAAPVDLRAGQGLSVAANGALGAVAAVAPSGIALWRKGLVRFENTPLADALRELERYGPTGLVIRNRAVAALPLGGSYPVDHPAEFARMVTQILPVKLVVGADGTTEIASAP